MAAAVQGSRTPDAPLPQRTSPAASEDLFDFPVVEMRHSSVQDAAPPPSAPVPAKAPAGGAHRSAANASTGAARERTAREAAARPVPAASGARESAPAKAAPEPALPSAQATAGPAKLLARTEPLPSAATDAKRKRSSGRAADPDLGPETERASTARAEVPSVGPQDPARPSPLRERSRHDRIAAAALVLFLLANLGAWALFERSASDVRASVEQLRSELVTRAPAAAPAEETGMQVAKGRADAAADTEASPADAAELALEVARAEIAGGRSAAARRRLHRLLAAVDGFEAPRRETIEAQASFLRADSYRRAADRAHEAAR